MTNQRNRPSYDLAWLRRMQAKTPIVLSALHVNASGQRYEALFGGGVDWHPEGLDAWLASAPSSPVRPAA